MRSQTVAEYRPQANQLTGISLSAVPMWQSQLRGCLGFPGIFYPDDTGILVEVQNALSAPVFEHKRIYFFLKDEMRQLPAEGKNPAQWRAFEMLAVDRLLLPELARTGEDRQVMGPRRAGR